MIVNARYLSGDCNSSFLWNIIIKDEKIFMRSLVEIDNFYMFIFVYYSYKLKHNKKIIFSREIYLFQINF